MNNDKTSISDARSYREIGEYWSAHEVTEVWEQTKPVDFEVDIQSVKRYYPLDKDIAEELTKIALMRGVAAETLLNLWIKEKLAEQRG